jgi:hypothetical protein
MKYIPMRCKGKTRREILQIAEWKLQDDIFAAAIKYTFALYNLQFAINAI